MCPEIASPLARKDYKRKFWKKKVEEVIARPIIFGRSNLSFT